LDKYNPSIRTPKCNVTLDRSNKDMHCEIEAASARLSSANRGRTVTYRSYRT